jgi:restriction system protein
MKGYYRVMLGKGSVHAEECFGENCIGADFGVAEDLTGKLPGVWREFNRVFIPKYLVNRPDKTKIAAGLACGALWTIAKGIQDGDVVLCPDGSGSYRVGDIVGGYMYRPGGVLPHRRPVRWRAVTVKREDMSERLQNSTGSIGTVSDVSAHRDEIELLIGGAKPPVLVSTDGTIEDPAAFAMEKHLEDFLVANWSHTDLGREFRIYEEEGECVGQQYPTDTGPIDILAISRDSKRLLVLELKKGRASDVVVGQLLRYMGFVQEELAEDGQAVTGAIIALDDDPRIRRALAVVPCIEFFRYQVSFKLVKG